MVLPFQDPQTPAVTRSSSVISQPPSVIRSVRRRSERVESAADRPLSPEADEPDARQRQQDLRRQQEQHDLLRGIQGPITRSLSSRLQEAFPATLDSDLDINERLATELIRIGQRDVPLPSSLSEPPQGTHPRRRRRGRARSGDEDGDHGEEGSQSESQQSGPRHKRRRVNGQQENDGSPLRHSSSMGQTTPTPSPSPSAGEDTATLSRNEARPSPLRAATVPSLRSLRRSASRRSSSMSSSLTSSRGRRYGRASTVSSRRSTLSQMVTRSEQDEITYEPADSIPSERQQMTPAALTEEPETLDE